MALPVWRQLYDAIVANPSVVKLDQLAATTDNTVGNADTAKHGLMQKYPGGTANFLRADGTFAAPTATPSAHATTHEPGGSDPMAVDAAAATGSLRTIGTTALKACAGNDARLSDSRTPTTHASTHNSGGSDALAADSAAATPSLRSLGTTSVKACAGDDARLSDSRTPSAHKTSHQDGGSDELNVGALSGVLADPQPPIIGSGATQAVAGNDARLTDARTPTAHAASHDSGGSDAMAIDAAAATGSLRTIGTTALKACAGNDARLSDARTPTAHASTHNSGGSDALAADAAAGTPSLRSLGVTSTTACAGNDSRLSDARTPTAHAASHKSGGSDAIKLDEFAAPTDVTTLDASTSAHGLMKKYPGDTASFLRADGQFAVVDANPWARSLMLMGG